MTKEEKELLEIEKGLNQINEEVGGMMDKIKGLNKVAEFEQMEKTNKNKPQENCIWSFRLTYLFFRFCFFIGINH